MTGVGCMYVYTWYTPGVYYVCMICVVVTRQVLQYNQFYVFVDTPFFFFMFFVIFAGYRNAVLFCGEVWDGGGIYVAWCSPVQYNVHCVFGYVRNNF